GGAAIEARFGGVYPPWYESWQVFDVERDALLGLGGRRVRPTGEPPEGFAALLPDEPERLDPLDAQLALEVESRLPSWVLVIADRLARRAVEDAGLFDPDAVERLRVRAAAAPAWHVETIRAELVLSLVLGCQLLHQRFVARSS